MEFEKINFEELSTLPPDLESNKIIEFKNNSTYSFDQELFPVVVDGGNKINDRTPTSYFEAESRKIRTFGGDFEVSPPLTDRPLDRLTGTPTFRPVFSPVFEDEPLDDFTDTRPEQPLEATALDALLSAFRRPLEAPRPIWTPEKSAKANVFRTAKLDELGSDYQQVVDVLVGEWRADRAVGLDGREALAYMTPDAKNETFDGTVVTSGERHRRLTPRLQEIFYRPATRRKIMSAIDRTVAKKSQALEEKLVRANVSPIESTPEYDLVIVGSGPHGTMMASAMRELHPGMKILMIDDSRRIGGQFRQYGDKPAFIMNSRVRKADRNRPNVPRTPGDINPLGDYAPLQLSDFVRRVYADNTEIGDAVAVNGYLSADDVLVNAQYVGNKPVNIDGDEKEITIQTASGKAKVKAKMLTIATGLEQETAIESAKEYASKPWYFRPADLYTYFGDFKPTADNSSPLKFFDGKKVIVIGGGDSALTALEALLGKLPSETYGRGGPGRYSPQEIYWAGAPGTTSAEVEKCIRSRYKDTIVQALPKKSLDPGAKIILSDKKVFAIQEEADYQRPASVIIEGLSIGFDIVIDCTSRKVDKNQPKLTGKFDPSTVFVGPAAPTDVSIGFDERRIIADLGVSENTVALWALVNHTKRMISQLAERYQPSKK